MKTAIIIIAIIVLSPFCKGQISIYKAKLQLENLTTLKASISKRYNDKIYVEIDKQASNKPKGEFETTDEYNKRINKWRELYDELAKKYEVEKKLEFDNYLTNINKITEAEFVEPVDIVLINYNADIEEYSLEILNKFTDDKYYGTIKIKSEDAILLKNNFIKIKYAIGIFQILENGQEYITAAGFEFNNIIYEISLNYDFKKINRYFFSEQHSSFQPLFFNKNHLAVYTYYNAPTIRLIDLVTGLHKDISSENSYGFQYKKLFAHPSGDFLLAWKDFGFDIYNINTKKWMNIEKDILHLSLSPDGNILATFYDGRISLYDTEQWIELGSIKYLKSFVKAINFSNDSKHIIYLVDDELFFIDIYSRKISKQVKIEVGLSQINDFKFISNDRILVRGNGFIVIDSNSGKVMRAFFSDKVLEKEVEFSPDNKFFFADGKLFETSYHKMLSAIGKWYSNCKFSADGRYIAIDNELWQIIKRKNNGLAIPEALNNYKLDYLSKLNSLAQAMLRDKVISKAYFDNKNLGEIIHYKMIDLNDDFIPEYLVSFIKDDIFNQVVYRRDGEEFILLINLGSIVAFNLIQPSHYGYKSIEVILKLVGTDAKPIKNTYVYDGKRYVNK